MYDGTLLECHNLIFDTELEYIKANTIDEFQKQCNETITVMEKYNQYQHSKLKEQEKQSDVYHFILPCSCLLVIYLICPLVV